jgi:hypothetical protein
MRELELREEIRSALAAFSDGDLPRDASRLFETMGDKSEKRFPLSSYGPEDFLADFDGGNRTSSGKALAGEWTSVCPLFQVTASVDSIVSTF